MARALAEDDQTPKDYSPPLSTDGQGEIAVVFESAPSSRPMLPVGAPSSAVVVIRWPAR